VVRALVSAISDFVPADGRDGRCRPHLKRTNRSWRLDETYINIKGRDRFLYRAVDSRRAGQTIDFLLTDRRDAAMVTLFGVTIKWSLAVFSSVNLWKSFR
jgi:hypothetical protein